MILPKTVLYNCYLSHNKMTRSPSASKTKAPITWATMGAILGKQKEMVIQMSPSPRVARELQIKVNLKLL
jgi:hypothetical protein